MLEIGICLALALLVNRLLAVGKAAESRGDDMTANGVGCGLVVIGIPVLLLAWTAAMTAINGGAP